jgi:hypothetical protein
MQSVILKDKEVKQCLSVFVHFTKYLNAQIKENYMDGACGMDAVIGG